MEIHPHEGIAGKYVQQRKSWLGKRIFCFFLNDCVQGDQFSKVAHDETGKDFLEDVLHLFCVKGEQSKSIFELAERGLNTPAHGIELFKFRRWKLIGVKVGNDRFKRILRNFEAGNTEVHFIE